MNITVQIKCGFDAVFMINGVFVERTINLLFKSDEVMYITVLPLSAVFLPYTVKFIGGKVHSNADLCKSYLLPDGKILLIMSPRYNYVYAPKTIKPTNEELVPAFFYAVKGGDFSSARRMMTGELSSSVDNTSLSAFFDEYSDITDAEFLKSDAPENSYFLLGANGARLYSFELKGGAIDNITEYDS